jgi:hypothetical protein
LIDFYRAKNLLRIVDGDRDRESIYRDVEQIVRGITRDLEAVP